jgi:hypothetical protein
MALEAGSSGGGGRGWGGRFRSLMRRKQVDSDRVRAEGQPQLAKELNVPELVAIGAVSSSFEWNPTAQTPRTSVYDIHARTHNDRF